MSDICYDKIPKAIYAERENNQIFLQDKKRNDWTETDVLEKVTNQGYLSPHKNINIIKTSKGMACPKGFKDADFTLEDCRDDNFEAGTQNARDNCSLDGCTDVDTLVTKDNGNCRPEMCEIPYSQGFREIKPFDWQAEYKSQTMCAEELYNHGGSEHVMNYNSAVKEHFSQWLVYNYQMNLLNELALRAESNSSEGHFKDGTVASRYNWHGKPQGYLSISHLKQLWKHHHSNNNLDDGKLRISGPMEDFIRAIQEYECNVLGKQFCDVSYNRVQYENVEGELRMREYMEYENICYYKNEYPRKAIWIQQGSTAKLKYIYPYIDSTDLADVGVMRDTNPDYYGEYVKCDGSFHDLITIYDIVPKGAAKRWTLDKPINPESNNTGTGLELNVATDWQVGDCNINKDMWFYHSRPRMRHLIEYPEKIGFHLALSRDTGGGEIVISTKNTRPPSDTGCGTPTTPQDYAECGEAWCDDCNVVDVCDTVVATITPCPAKDVFYQGTYDAADVTASPEDAAFRITLSAAACEAGTIDYAFVDGTAVFGTNYDVATGQTGTLTVNEGDIEILVPFTVLGLAPDADPAVVAEVTGSLEISNPTGGVVLGTECVSSTFCILDDSTVCETPECGGSVSAVGGTGA